MHCFKILQVGLKRNNKVPIIIVIVTVKQSNSSDACLNLYQILSSCL